MVNVLHNRPKLRAMLLQYPDINEENVEDHLYRYTERVEEKAKLRSRGLSNFMAERMLELNGWPRPPGWASVFFYPEGSLPRISMIFWSIIVCLIGYWFFG